MGFSVYRDDSDAVERRLREALRERSREVRRLTRVVRPILACRTGRILAGCIGVGGSLWLFASATGHALAGDRWAVWPAFHIVALWIAMTAAYLLGSASAELSFTKKVRSMVARSGDARTDLARLEQARPFRIFPEALAETEAMSIGLPLAAVGLLMPLTLHLLVFSVSHTCVRFDEWVKIAAWSTGLAHSVLAWLGFRLGKALCKAEPATEPQLAASRGWAALVITTAVSLVPGAVLDFIPVIATFFTGLLFIPLSFHLMGELLSAERRALARIKAFRVQ